MLHAQPFCSINSHYPLTTLAYTIIKNVYSICAPFLIKIYTLIIITATLMWNQFHLNAAVDATTKVFVQINFRLWIRRASNQANINSLLQMETSNQIEKLDIKIQPSKLICIRISFICCALSEWSFRNENKQYWENSHMSNESPSSGRFSLIRFQLFGFWSFYFLKLA